MAYSAARTEKCLRLYCSKTMTPEGRVKVKLKRALKTLPQQYQFWPVQSGLGAATLDCLLCFNGEFIGIETKALGKKMTERQQLTAKAINAAGGRVFLIDGDVSLQYFLRMLDK